MHRMQRKSWLEKVNVYWWLVAQAIILGRVAGSCIARGQLLGTIRKYLAVPDSGDKDRGRYTIHSTML